MKLIIDNYTIEAPISDILYELKRQTGYLDVIKKENNDNIAITCPWHSNGHESHPSAAVFTRDDDPNVEYGFTKCFTCGTKAPLYSLVARCFGGADYVGKKWLIENFGVRTGSNKFKLRPIQRKGVLQQLSNKYLDESILNEYNYIHPYMYKRKLTDDVIRNFKIGYDINTDCITFPCWDIHGNLVSISRRSVTGKSFMLESNKEKEVYLLNFFIKKNIPTLYIAESQINALTLNSWGYPAVALMGTGTPHQYDLLEESGIKSFMLCLDGDHAGHSGTDRFIKRFSSKRVCSVKQIPDNKDVNDLTKEEFDNCYTFSEFEWKKRYLTK